MFNKTTLVLAAALVAGSTLAARADATMHDANTGLEARYYYDTLENLERQGLPISDKARAYLHQHGGSRVAVQRHDRSQAAAGRRGNVYLLEDRTHAYGSYNSYSTSNDKHRPW